MVVQRGFAANSQSRGAGTSLSARPGLRKRSRFGYNERVKAAEDGLGFGDALLAGAIRRDWLSGRPPGPSAGLRRLRPRLARLLARVDGDAIDRADRVPASVIAGLRRLGVFRLRLPREHGGLGLSHSDYRRAVALIAARSAGLSMWVTTHQGLGAAALVAAHGTPDQKVALLPRMAAGELSALAVTEVEAGLDAARTASAARPLPGGRAYRLDGRKLWVTNAPVARWLAVLARAPGGLAIFVVDARARGVRVERRCRFLGLRGMENGVVRLTGALAPVSRRVGAEGEGLRLAASALGTGRLSVVSRALGLAGECRRAARAWIRGRRALAAEPAVAARLARLDELVAALEAVDARVALWADSGRELRTDSALAKLFAASAAWEAADVALQLRGARGYETADSQRARGENPVPAERWLRDARGLRLIEGSDDALRAALARRGLELARAGARAPRGRDPLARRAAALAADFRSLARGAGGAVPARALELVDEAARLFAAACLSAR